MPIKTAAMFVTTTMLLASAAHADALQDYKAAAVAGLDACQIVMNSNRAAAQFKMPQPGGLAECVAEKKAATKTAYEAANKAAKPGARPALKEYLAGTFAALDGILPLTDESGAAYEARKRERELRLIDLWARVEIAL